MASEPWLVGGPAFGLLLLAMLGWVVIKGDNFDFHHFGQPLLNIGMFAFIYVSFGLLVVPLHDWMQRALPRPSLTKLGVVSLGIHALGLLLALVFALTIVRFGGFGKGLEAVISSLVLFYVVVVMPILGLLLARAAERFQGLSDLRDKGGWLLAAIVVLALPIGLGVALDVREVADIIRADRQPLP